MATPLVSRFYLVARLLGHHLGKMERQEGTNLLEMAMGGVLFRVCRAWSLIMEHDEQFGSRKIDTTGESSLLLQISISNHCTTGCADNE